MGGGNRKDKVSNISKYSWVGVSGYVWILYCVITRIRSVCIRLKRRTVIALVRIFSVRFLGFYTFINLKYCARCGLSGERDMNFESIRYYLAVIFLVLGSSLLYTAIVVWALKEMVSIEDFYLRATYIVVYVVISVVGLFFYTPRLRGIV